MMKWIKPAMLVGLTSIANDLVSFQLSYIENIAYHPNDQGPVW